MTGSMYAAISGLKTHMSALNVIGQNISNVNTVGYKATRYTFNEALYTNVRTGSNGTGILGGFNPAQIGYGVSIGTIDLNMATATYSPTGMALDCMIDGDGFFIVGDKGIEFGDGDGTEENPFRAMSGVTNQSTLQGMDLTRLGNFEFKDGYLVDGNGEVVYGFLNTVAGEEADNGEALDISRVLTAIRMPMAYKITDNDGNVSYQIMYPTEYESNGSWVVRDADDETGFANGADIPDGAIQVRLSPDTVAIDATGKITAITSDGQTILVGYVAIGKVDSPNGVTHMDGRYYKAMGGAGNLRVTTIGGSVTYVANANEDGESRTNVDVESAGDTQLVTGGLESSNTDLATEISNMIVIQRGYQANTRIVTVTDSMLEELVNMKR